MQTTSWNTMSTAGVWLAADHKHLHRDTERLFHISHFLSRPPKEKRPSTFWISRLLKWFVSFRAAVFLWTNCFPTFFLWCVVCFLGILETKMHKKIENDDKNFRKMGSPTWQVFIEVWRLLWQWINGLLEASSHTWNKERQIGFLLHLQKQKLGQLVCVPIKSHSKVMSFHFSLIKVVNY